MAIPTGYMADRVGRKKTMAVILLGMLASIAWILLICMLDSKTRDHT